MVRVEFLLLVSEIVPRKTSLFTGGVLGGGTTMILFASKVSVVSRSPRAMILSLIAKSLVEPSFLLARITWVLSLRRIRLFPRKLLRMMLRSVISVILPTNALFSIFSFIWVSFS